MLCPQCRAEYRDGFTVCADCEIPLVAQLPVPPSFPAADTAADPSESEVFAAPDAEDPFCAFWEGEDPRICADICSVLDEANIPRRVLRHEARLFRITANSHIKIGVPFSLYEKAENAIGEAFGGAEQAHRLLRPNEANRRQFAAIARESLKEHMRQERAIWPFLSPGLAENDAEPSPPEQLPANQAAARRQAHGGISTQEVWHGASLETGDFIAACFAENAVPFSSAVGSDGMRISVNATDELRAREIVREVLDATPPE